MLTANTLLPAVPTKDIAARKSQLLFSMVGFFYAHYFYSMLQRRFGNRTQRFIDGKYFRLNALKTK